MDSPAPFMPVPEPGFDRVGPVLEAELRRRVVAEALSWVTTPYVQCADRKGQAVDCAMLLVRCWVDTGIFQPFDPRPYPPTWFVHHADERYLRWMAALSAEVATPVPGDIALFFFGRCFSHGAIVTRPGVVCSASAIHRKCTENDIREPWLSVMDARSKRPRPRPVKYFDVFASIRCTDG
jgi:hypothetical protein